MFGLTRRGTVIAEGLKIEGSVTAKRLVEVNGQINGELHCTSLILTKPMSLELLAPTEWS